jgi:hypothetical protein
MPHFFVDDGFSDSKEVLAIPARHRLAAVGLWTLCGSWSASKLQNGFVSDEALKRFGARPTIINALCQITGPDGDDWSLWMRVSGGIRFTNWAKWQRTREQVEAYRAAQAEKKRRQRNGTKPPATSDDRDVSPGDIKGDNETCPQGTPQTPIPIPKPVPKEPSVTSVGGCGGKAVAQSAPVARGTRLPDNWMPDHDVIDAMRQQFPHVDLKAVHDEFADYWRAVPGAKGRKTDWNATWRNRVREVAGRQQGRAAPNGHKIPASDAAFAAAQALKDIPAARLEIE